MKLTTLKKQLSRTSNRLVQNLRHYTYQQFVSAEFRERVIFDYYFWTISAWLFCKLSALLDKFPNKWTSFTLRRRIDEIYKISTRAKHFGRPLTKQQLRTIHTLQNHGYSDKQIRRLVVGGYIKNDGDLKKLSIRDRIVNILFWLTCILCISSIFYLVSLSYIMSSGSILFTLFSLIFFSVFFFCVIYVFYLLSVLPVEERKRLDT